MREPSADRNRRVVQALWRRGVCANLEFEDRVSITAPGGRLSVLTGFHSWDYGSWEEGDHLRETMMQPIERGPLSDAVQRAEREAGVWGLPDEAGGEAPCEDVERIADAWARAMALAVRYTVAARTVEEGGRSPAPPEVRDAVDLLAAYGRALEEARGADNEGRYLDRCEAWIAGAIEVQFTEPDDEQYMSEFFTLGEEGER